VCGARKTRIIHRERGDNDPLKTDCLYRGAAEETNSSVRLLLSQKAFREGISIRHKKFASSKF
jgi:hypothetical protein